MELMGMTVASGMLAPEFLSVFIHTGYRSAFAFHSTNQSLSRHSTALSHTLGMAGIVFTFLSKIEPLSRFDPALIRDLRENRMPTSEVKVLRSLDPISTIHSVKHAATDEDKGHVQNYTATVRDLEVKLDGGGNDSGDGEVIIDMNTAPKSFVADQFVPVFAQLN